MTRRPRERGLMTMGLDLGDRASRYCGGAADGTAVEEGRCPTTAAGLHRRFGHGPTLRIAIEAGTHSAWVGQILTSWGHEVLVANPRRLRLIYENDRKSDRVDAEWLARVARLDPKLLAPVELRSPDARGALAVLRSRDALVRARTQLVNHVRGATKAFGARLPACSTPSFARRATAHLPPDLITAFAPVLDTIAHLTQAIRDFDRQIAVLAETCYPATQRLRQVPGVGPVTALTFVLTVDDPSRFPHSRALGAYFGLRPRQHDSGTARPRLRITKTGDIDVRRLLVGCAHYILGPFGPDTDLRRWGLALAERGGIQGKKRAIVAVARKLAVLLHRLWLTGDPYRPLRSVPSTALTLV